MKRNILLLLLANQIAMTALSAEKPDLRIGLLSDTHIKKTEESCRKSKLAFELFKKHQVDAVVHLGDLADFHYREGYRIYRRLFNEVFGKKTPREIIVYAYHDMTRDAQRHYVDWDKAMREFKEDLQIGNDPYDRIVLKGYPFLVYPECADLERQEKEIREALEKYPDKPVFVLDHIPPYDTVPNTRIRGVREQRLERRRIMDKYPRVVHLSGHIHSSLHDERSIWQQGFTAINIGTLAHWGGRPVNCWTEKKEGGEAAIMDVFPDKIVVHRYTVADGKEIRPDRPWTVPLPFDPATAPYNVEHRRRHSPVPVFPAGSEITVTPVGDPFRKIEFTFPEAEHPEKCYRYTAVLSKKNPSGDYERVAFKEDFGGFYLKEKRPAAVMSFDAGFFDAGAEYRISIHPQNFYGGEGKPLCRTFTVKKPERGEIRFESCDPMRECPVLTGLEGNQKAKQENGFYLFPYEYIRLVFPAKIWDAPAGTRFRLTADISTEQQENSSLTIVLRDPSKHSSVRPRLITPSGLHHRYRIVIDFIRKDARDHYALLLGEGLPGKVAFHYLRVEKLPF